jgi:polysaccharide pyruvyl transferase WcaK-like protein
MIDALAQVIAWARGTGLAVQVLLGANAHLAADDVTFVKALRERAGAAFELVLATSEAQWLTTIAQARLLISGRFHHSIAAAFVGTPFLLYDSNTAKVDGLVRMLELSSQVRVAPNTPLVEQATALWAAPETALVQRDVRRRLLESSRNNFAGVERWLQSRC